MNKPLHITRLDLEKLQLENVLSLIAQKRRPLILTEKGRGVAAVLPYTDPNDIKGNNKNINRYD